MADGTAIEWTDATWNPVTGCTIVSPGCAHCYAMKLAGGRLQHHPSRAGLTVDSKAGPVWNGQVRFNAEQLPLPLRWTRPRKIFVCAHGDLFAEGVPDEWIDQVFAVMALCPQHVFQVLTKRPSRMRGYVEALGNEMDRWKRLGDAAGPMVGNRGYHDAGERAWPLANVWVGTSVEDQKRADERIPELLATPAAVRFLSIEPMLGSIDLAPAADETYQRLSEWYGPDGFDPSGMQPRQVRRHGYFPRVDWVIVGGESGPNARPMHPDWARALRDICAAAGVPFFFKQWGEWAPGESVGRRHGIVATATWFDNAWRKSTEDLARTDGHIDDEPDLYRVGKKAAGRLLDGAEHNAMPAVGTGVPKAVGRAGALPAADWTERGAK